jgi:pSer/pThr/pTyr-binding forkhead associated (FHA) protein
LEEQLALLSSEDRAVVAEIQNSQGEKAMILIARGSHKGSRFLITAEGASIGRSAASEIFLDDVTVSRTHATVVKNGKDFILKDSGSLNGTYINNVSISEHTLVSGDEFQIGKFHLLFIGSNK